MFAAAGPAVRDWRPVADVTVAPRVISRAGGRLDASPSSLDATSEALAERATACHLRASSGVRAARISVDEPFVRSVALEWVMADSPLRLRRSRSH